MTALGADPDPDCVSARDPEHAWNRGFGFWDLLFWGSMLVGLGIAVASTDFSGTRRILAAACVVAIALAFQLLRPRTPDAVAVPATVYLLICIVAIGVACAAIPSMSLLLTVGFSQIWMFTPGVRAGTVLACLLALSALIGLLTGQGWSWEGLGVLGTIMLISLFVSIGFAIWISRIIDQSKDRAELIHQLEATRSQLGASHHAQGVMAERERIAREIHDTLAQGFTSVIMLSQSALAQLDRDPSKSAARLASIEDVARENLAEARALIAAFSPVGLDGSTLVDAVSRLADRFATETGLRVSLDLPADRSALAGLSRDREVVLLRAIQESLTNVRRHAQATSVTITISSEPGRDDASVEVTDDGVGFAPGTTDGYGLTGMRSRVQDAGGELDVASSPGAGTRVIVHLPSTPTPRDHATSSPAAEVDR